MSRSTHATALRAECPRCKSPPMEWCVNPDGSPRQQSHPERSRAAQSVPVITDDQLQALDRIHTDPSAPISRPVEIALRNKRWIRALDPPTPPAPEGTRYLKRPKRRYEVTAAGQWARENARRAG